MNIMYFTTESTTLGESPSETTDYNVVINSTTVSGKLSTNEDTTGKTFIGMIINYHFLNVQKRLH